MRIAFSSIEPLESRIAPAAIFSFTDVDGDRVKIVVSKGTNADLAADGVVNLTNAAQAAIGKGHELQALNLGAVFAGATVTITATPSKDLSAPGEPAKGDGFTNVGLINAPAIDLGSVKIAGDLGKILVGDDNSRNKTVGLGSLSVRSMGNYGISTQAGATPDLISRFENGVGSISVAGNVKEVFLRATATGALPTAKIGSVTIAGSLVGGAADDSGQILASDGIGTVKINGNLVGSSGKQSGRIGTSTGGTIGKVTIGGTIFGGSDNFSGSIDSGAGIASVSVKGDLVGGSAFKTGVIQAKTSIGSVTIGGSVIGGSFTETGGIESDGSIGKVKIGVDLRGRDFSSASNFKHTAFVLAETSIGSVVIGGSVLAANQSGGGALKFSGAIQAGKDLGTVSIGGGVLGNESTPVVISGFGQAVKRGSDLAIKGISISGTVERALIQGGYSTDGVAGNGDAQIGAIKIGGDLIATSIVAGVVSTDAFFGNFDRVITAGNTAGIVSKIVSLTVGGQIMGTVDPGPPTLQSVDVFGIEAQFIGSITTGSTKLKFNAGNGNDDFRLSRTTIRDVHVVELPGV